MSNTFMVTAGILAVLLVVGIWLCGIRYIPHNRVGIVEKLWSPKGSLTGGRIIAPDGEAGFQTRLLRGGIQFGFYPWQYRIHAQPLVTVGEGKIGYVYARDGEPLPATQTLGRAVECNRFQDAQTFLTTGGQRGRQREILREGVYAINTALFVVITEEQVYAGPGSDAERAKFNEWQCELAVGDGFAPVVIGAHGESHRGQPPALPAGDAAQVQLVPGDSIGVVSVHDGPPIPSGEIIAPEVNESPNRGSHLYFQDPEAFLALGGHRGKQLQVLTDGTFFINRWFATVEVQPKTLIPIGYVGVVVSYHGTLGDDSTGDQFRYGEQVDPGQRGVWNRALPPGKYALNPYALRVELVPTVNFVLRWISGQSEAHRYDTELASLELITADGYEPMLPLSLVLHIDYQKASSVVQRFGDVKRLISQTLDPILTAYFRDVAQASSMLDLLTKREEIQARATAELGRRFGAYDINCVAVLIGRPESQIAAGSGREDPIERLFDQLRVRRLAEEQKATFAKQEEAAQRLQQLNEANAAAEKQRELTQTRIDIEVAGNRGAAQLAEAESLAKRDIARAEGESRAKQLLGAGEASRIAQIGQAEADVNQQKIAAYGDPRLFALSLLGEQLAHSQQPLVPQQLFALGEGQNGGASGSLLTQLLGLLVGEKAAALKAARPAPTTGGSATKPTA
ncbi:MAG: hypothetical protein JSR82_17925 [Verrucomicrobia bacterium]|nr:hypothetical protein [Verrucomicrobiota bacterium]